MEDIENSTFMRKVIIMKLQLLIRQLDFLFPFCMHEYNQYSHCRVKVENSTSIRTWKKCSFYWFYCWFTCESNLFFYFHKMLILFVSTFKIFIKIVIRRIRDLVISPHSCLPPFFCFTCSSDFLFLVNAHEKMNGIASCPSFSIINLAPHKDV